MRLHGAARALRDATCFAEVGAVACAFARSTLDAAQSLTALFDARARPVMSVDDIATFDNARLRYVEQPSFDPQLARIVETHAPVGDHSLSRGEMEAVMQPLGYVGPMVPPRTCPLIEPAGLLGMFRFGLSGPLTEALCTDLSVLSQYLSTRLVQLGITATPSRTIALTPGQRRVAELAGVGLTNREIAELLALSVNTVKKHLKAVFERCDVTNRTELAVMLRRDAGRDTAPAGVSRLGEVWVARRTTP